MTTTSQSAGPDEGRDHIRFHPADGPPAHHPGHRAARRRAGPDGLDDHQHRRADDRPRHRRRRVPDQVAGGGYALAMGVLLVVGGRLGDRYGKRRMFLIGIAGFTLASLWCGLSVDPAMLIAGRLVQGGFGALLIPQGIGILIGAFSREQLPRVFSAFGPVMGASAVLGPIVAGFLISANIAGLTWRPIFLINIVLGTAGFIAALRLLPHDGPASAVPIDGLGSGLLGASMLALIYGLIEGSTAGWTAVPVLCLAAGAALLAGFGVRQRLAAEPLILPSLLANRGFTAGLLLGLAFFAAVNGLAYVISLFFQTALGLGLRGRARPEPADGRHHRLLVRVPPARREARARARRHRPGHHPGRRRGRCGRRSWPKAPRSACGRWRPRSSCWALAWVPASAASTTSRSATSLLPRRAAPAAP